ncbi:hypothetical protein [Novosphingobium sp. YAF33]|uniref:hypothetical protein n=1 Tax=Novosphingobium sp. YAF33 TaxID=3233082 RepID=UPI003F994FBB
MKLSGLFAIGDHLKCLSETGDPLETLNAIIDSEVLRPVLLGGLAYSNGTVAAIARKVVINTQTAFRPACVGDWSGGRDHLRVRERHHAHWRIRCAESEEILESHEQATVRP